MSLINNTNVAMWHIPTRTIQEVAESIHVHGNHAPLYKCRSAHAPESTASSNSSFNVNGPWFFHVLLNIGTTNINVKT